MTRDKGVHPGLVQRAFAKSTWDSYTSQTSKQQARAGYVERETKAEKLVKDIKELDKAQAERPLKPPGR